MPDSALGIPPPGAHHRVFSRNHVLKWAPPIAARGPDHCRLVRGTSARKELVRFSQGPTKPRYQTHGSMEITEVDHLMG